MVKYKSSTHPGENKGSCVQPPHPPPDKLTDPRWRRLPRWRTERQICPAPCRPGRTGRTHSRGAGWWSFSRGRCSQSCRPPPPGVPGTPASPGGGENWVRRKWGESSDHVSQTLSLSTPHGHHGSTGGEREVLFWSGLRQPCADINSTPVHSTNAAAAATVNFQRESQPRSDLAASNDGNEKNHASLDFPISQSDFTTIWRLSWRFDLPISPDHLVCLAWPLTG